MNGLFRHITCALVLAVLPMGLYAQETEKNPEEQGYINALEYSMQKRHRPANEPFVNERFIDNTFISLNCGSYQISSPTAFSFAWGPEASLSFGKWLNPFNALRLSLGWSGFVRNNDDAQIDNIGLDLSYLFNLSSYIGGYRPSRFFEISTVAGLGYRCSLLPDDVTHVAALHLGFNFNFRFAKGMDVFVEPLFTLNSNGMDHTGDLNWHHYNLGYGGKVGLKYRIHSDKAYRVYEHEKPGKYFVALTGGLQYQNSALVYESLGVVKSAGPHAAISFGRYFSDCFALRTSLFGSHDNWCRYASEIWTTYYGGFRLEGMFDLMSAIRGKQGIFSLSLLFGPEIGYMYKKDYVNDIGRLYFGLAGGFQTKFHVHRNLALYLEPRFSSVPYSCKVASADPLKRVRENFYDNLLNLNFGIEIKFE